MNITILSDYNIAGQLTYLYRAINKYTNHKARCIILQDDYMSYDKDIILNTGNNINDVIIKKEVLEETKEIIDKTDFFFFGRYIIPIPGVDFTKIINRNNCCISYYGSFLRIHHEKIKKFHNDSGIFAISTDSWKLAPLLDFSFQHIHSYFTKYGDMEEKDLPIITKRKEGENLKVVVGSAGNKRKGYDFLIETIKDIKGLDLEIIQGVSNQEALKGKEKCNITFTSLIGGWGVSGIEGMWQGHTILSCVDPYMLSFYPEQPAILIDRSNLRAELLNLVDKNEEVYQRGLKGREFVKRYFTTKRLLKQYMYIMELIINNDMYRLGVKSKVYYSC